MLQVITLQSKLSDAEGNSDTLLGALVGLAMDLTVDEIVEAYEEYVSDSADEQLREGAAIAGEAAG